MICADAPESGAEKDTTAEHTVCWSVLHCVAVCYNVVLCDDVCCSVV